MALKKIMFATLLLLTIITIGAVSASEDIAGDNVTAIEPTGEQTVQAVDEIKQTDEVIVQTDNDEILSEKDDGTFTALQNKIDNAAEGSTITLENDYIYNKGFGTKGINISKSLTINGNGHTIDGKEISRIFNCYENKIILNNINFHNARYKYEGGAIHNEANLEINNCNFINNHVYSDSSSLVGNDRISGGAIYSTNNLIVSDCKFDSNSADMDSFGAYGGAISNKGYGKITNCIFNNNDAGYGYWNDGSGGAIYNNGNLNIYKSKFTNNHASEGIAIFNSGTINVYDDTYDSATLNVYDSTFSDTQSQSIYTRLGVTKLSNCKFYEPILTAKAVTKIYGTSTKLVVYLKDNEGNAIVNANVNVNLANKVTPITTNSKGQATMAIGQAPGTYYAKITYPEAKQVTVKIVVKKATPKLTAKAKTYKVKVAKKYSVALKTNQNRALKNAKVTIKIGKLSYTVKTSAKGVATFNLAKLTKGNFVATVKFAGNKYYNAKTVKAKITVR